MQDWPFEDPKNLAVITVRQIVHQGEPILHVTHDREDGSWQFLGSDTPREDDAAVIALAEVVSIDPSVAQLADLPLGWHAWRNSIDEQWRRAPSS